VNYTYSGLSPMKRRELVTAYMNGYYRALELDIEEIKKLQSDKGVLTLQGKNCRSKICRSDRDNEFAKPG